MAASALALVSSALDAACALMPSVFLLLIDLLLQISDEGLKMSALRVLALPFAFPPQRLQARHLIFDEVEFSLEDGVEALLGHVVRAIVETAALALRAGAAAQVV